MYDALCILIALPLLIWASIQDLKKREVKDITWAPMLIAGVILIPFRGWDYSAMAFFLLLVAVFILVAYTGLLGGGGDVKALLSLLVLFPEGILAILSWSVVILLLFALFSFLLKEKDILRKKIPFIPFLTLAVVLSMV